MCETASGLGASPSFRTTRRSAAAPPVARKPRETPIDAPPRRGLHAVPAPPGSRLSALSPATRPAPARMAETAASHRQRGFLHSQAAARAAPRDRLRECPLPESPGMLFATHGDVHGAGQCVHTAVRLLLGAARRAARPRSG